MIRSIGQSVPRVDARAKVTGAAQYPGDLAMDGMLYAKILFAGRPHARILNIDTSAAEAAPGVAAIFTARDVPVNEHGLQIPDQPVLCGPGSSKPGADVVRYVGDQVALVVAESERSAARARDLIRVEYEDLPVLTDAREAIKPGAPQLHPARHPSEIHPEIKTEGNLISHHQIRKGDVEAAWAQADVIVESEYRTPSQEHAFLQPEAGLAYIDSEDRVTVAVAGQWTSEDQHQIARALALPAERVRVIYPAIGGAFGGREDMSVQVVLALAASKLRRPVKIVWSRDESILGHCKRHPFWIRSKWAATRAGKLVAAEIRIVADGGAYCYTTNKVLGNATTTSAGPYEIPNVKVDVDGVYTNNPPSGAFRGFGSPQALFAAETQMNKLAEALEMDPVEFRLKNLLCEGSLTAMCTPLPGGISLVEVTEKCARAAGWQETGRVWRKPSNGEQHATVRRGIGLAAAFKNAGFSFGYRDNCHAKIELRGRIEVDEALVFMGSAEVGQGTHTVICQMAADALGVTLERVRLIASDTGTSPVSSGSVSASRMTLMAGNAIRGAAKKALELWNAEDRPAVGDFTYFSPQTTAFDPENGSGFPNFSYGYVALAVEVEVDTETGELRVLRVICADDVGKAINPQQVVGQIEGGVVQALGWVTCEDFRTAGGRVLTPNFSTYLIPTAADVPDRIEAIIVEKPNAIGPWGVRGMGEMPFIALAPALIAAVHDATGVWFDDFPLTPERVLKGLRRRIIPTASGDETRECSAVSALVKNLRAL
jgi:CO/xanthine dehydrogenase Mo-binding subunit